MFGVKPNLSTGLPDTQFRSKVELTRSIGVTALLAALWEHFLEKILNPRENQMLRIVRRKKIKTVLGSLSDHSLYPCECRLDLFPRDAMSFIANKY